MATQTVAQLKAELEQVKAERDEARAAASKSRDRFGTGLWANDNRTKDTQPEFRGTFRFVVPEDLKAGDHVWLDAGLWNYDEETSPTKYSENPPEFNLSVSVTSKEYASIKEEGRVEYLKKQAAKR